MKASNLSREASALQQLDIYVAMLMPCPCRCFIIRYYLMFMIVNFNAAEIFLLETKGGRRVAERGLRLLYFLILSGSKQPCFALPVSYEVRTIQCLNREKFATGEKTKSLFKRTSAAKLRLLEHSSDGPP